MKKIMYKCVRCGVKSPEPMCARCMGETTPEQRKDIVDLLTEVD